jgi:hypothetical protein
MDQEFRQKVKDAGSEAVDLLTSFLKGGDIDMKALRASMFMTGQAVKVSHMDQLKEHNDKSLAIRLFQLLPDDDEIKKEYLKLTNPKLKPLLLNGPKKTKKGKKK